MRVTGLPVYSPTTPCRSQTVHFTNWMISSKDIRDFNRLAGRLLIIDTRRHRPTLAVGRNILSLSGALMERFLKSAVFSIILGNFFVNESAWCLATARFIPINNFSISGLSADGSILAGKINDTPAVDRGRRNRARPLARRICSLERVKHIGRRHDDGW